MDNSNNSSQNNQTPSYYNPTGIVRDSPTNSTPLLNIEPPEDDPKALMQRKYPIKTIAGIMVLLVMVLAIPVSVFLTQRPTNVFIEADTPSPVATFPPTPTPTPTFEEEG